ncbi:hypothetical protein [Vulcanisaeta souniana]|uniref:hypothetical protein n=1 Tax=Vulcanisaeta souniana TaxID=164452 RepID=UPI000B2FB59E|nr:hypothetical protein [Vulcanisaeta souniana]
MTQGTGTIQVTNTQILSSGVNVNYGNTDSRSKLMMTNFVITEGRDIESYNDQPPRGYTDMRRLRIYRHPNILQWAWRLIKLLERHYHTPP